MTSEPIENLLLRRAELATGKLGLRLFILPKGETNTKRALWKTYLAKMLSVPVIHCFKLQGALLMKTHQRQYKIEQTKNQQTV